MSTGLVLAAGLGSRLRAVTSGPKWLVPVEHTSPMHEQLAALEAAAGVERVVVVASGDTTALLAAIDAAGCALPVEVIRNDDADRWNNWSTARVGLRHIGDGGVVLLNSDLFAHRDWLTESIEQLLGSPEPALLVDSERVLTDEAMKVAGDDRLARIGKTGVDEPVGEYVGMAWWPPASSRSFAGILDRYADDPDAAQHWYEHAIDEDLRAGATYRRVRTPSVDWVEIDDEADHRLAEALVHSWRSRNAPTA